MMEIVVNTWQTKSVPWVIQEPAPPKDIVQQIVESVEKLPITVNIPKGYSELSIPRYFLICYEEKGDGVEIVEIVGVRRDGSPTKWSYRAGYWHPACQVAISRALRRCLGSGKPVGSK